MKFDVNFSAKYCQLEKVALNLQKSDIYNIIKDKTMNILKSTIFAATMLSTMLLGSCTDKNVQVLTEQSERLNNELQTLVSENPNVLASATATYADDAFTVDVKLADSLFMTPQISEPLFEYFTACEVKNHLDKNLEATVNAMSAKKQAMTVNLTDVYGDSHTYQITPAVLRRMVSSPLTQFNYTDARNALFSAFEANEAIFIPEGAKVKGVSTSFKGGFYNYTVEFENASAYKGLTTANLKARALKVLKPRYDGLDSFRPVLFGMYKSLGVEGFHLIYTAGEKSPTLKTTVLLSDL